MKITIIGTGYVGLVTGTCLAETGNTVLCVDVDHEKVAKMQEGIIPIYEPNLDNLFKKNILENRLSFTTSLEDGVAFGDVIFLALPTPEGEDGSADLSYVLGVADNIGKLLNSYKVIVDKSTVPVGTAEKVIQTISKHATVAFDVVSNPEFLREGFAVDDFLNPERIVIGSESSKAIAIMSSLYKPYVDSGSELLVMDEKSAELTKYAANSFLATKITFMNEIANFCEQVGANVDHVRIGMGTDTRIGNRFLYPGIGYGGSCFPKDVKALHKAGQDVGYDFSILDAVVQVNNAQKTILMPKISAHFNHNLKGKKIAVWGLAFKPETDDIREAPSLYMIDELLKAGVELQVYDPEAMSNVKLTYTNKLNYALDMYTALDGVDALLICTEWDVFKQADFDEIRHKKGVTVIFDGRNIFDPQEMKSKGVQYFSIGR